MIMIYTFFMYVISNNSSSVCFGHVGDWQGKVRSYSRRKGQDRRENGWSRSN